MKPLLIVLAAVVVVSSLGIGVGATAAPTTVAAPIAAAVEPASYITEPQPVLIGQGSGAGTVVSTASGTGGGYASLTLDVEEGQPVVLFWQAPWQGCGYAPTANDSFGTTFMSMDNNFENVAGAGLLYTLDAKGSGPDTVSVTIHDTTSCGWTYRFVVVAESFGDTAGIDYTWSPLYGSDFPCIGPGVGGGGATPVCYDSTSTPGSIAAVFFGNFNCSAPLFSFDSPSSIADPVSFSSSGGSVVGGCSTNYLQDLEGFIEYPDAEPLQEFTASTSEADWSGSWLGYSITFSCLAGVQVSETGLPGGTTWTFTISNQSITSYSATAGVPAAPITLWMNYSACAGNSVYSCYPAVWQWTGYAPGHPEVFGNVTVDVFELVEILVNFGDPVEMTEEGLPAGLNWTVEVNGTTLSLTTAADPGTLSWGYFPNGLYPYIITQIAGYSQYSVPYIGQITVSNGGVDIIVSYQKPYTVTFSETGLPAGQGWTVRMGSRTGVSTTSTIAFTLTPNGTYFWTTNTTGDYVPTPLDGNVSVAGANLFVYVTFAAPSPTQGGAVLTLQLGNITPWTFRGGVDNYTASAIWKNTNPVAFTGTIDLIGSWLSGTGSTTNVTIFINGGPVNAYDAGTTYIVSPGQVDVKNDTSILVLAQYTHLTTVSTTAATTTVAVVNNASVTLPEFIIGAGIFIAIIVAVDGVSRRKDWVLLAAGALMTTAFVGVLCLAI